MRMIGRKKNGKSTTDVKKEILKGKQIEMTEFLWPVILSVWHEEKIPEQWNEGLITSLYKGKGDQEISDFFEDALFQNLSSKIFHPIRK